MVFHQAQFVCLLSHKQIVDQKLYIMAEIHVQAKKQPRTGATWIWVLVVLIIAAVVIYFFSTRNNNGNQKNTNTQNEPRSKSGAAVTENFAAATYVMSSIA
jgi:uncharacterized protein HemX